MLKVLLCSHGNLCRGMLDTIQIFIADSDYIQAIPFYTEQAKYNPEQALSDYVEAIKKDDTVLVFTDILWGSVNQKIMSLLQDRNNVYIITGFNLPVILELISTHPDELNEQSISIKCKACQESIVFMKHYQIDFNENDE